ncbi:MAG TPA: recombinase family protein [Candidatus Saccharimonadales bacterium]|nr:recombinase family protein [Candidatus Saccharimonadales bacterium]
MAATSERTADSHIIVDIYCRVSTDPQEDNTSLEEQETACRQFCKANGLVVGKVWREVFSGYAYRERPDLTDMRKRYNQNADQPSAETKTKQRAPKVRGVVIRTLDRLSRNQTHMAILMEEMEHNGVSLYCVKEKIDSKPMGKFVLAALALIAEMEREKIMDRTMTGRTNAVKAGKIKAVTNHHLRYGWQWENPETKEKIIANEEEAAIVLWMAQLYADGTGTYIIRQQLKARGVLSPKGKPEWDDYTIMDIIKDPRMTGTMAKAFWRKEKRYKSHHDEVDLPDGTYPEIIPLALHLRIKERMKVNKAQATRSSKYPEEFLLRAGYARCAVCNYSMGARYDKRRGSMTYRCNNNHGFIPSKQLDAWVWHKVEQMADHVALIEEVIALATNDRTIENNVRAIDVSITKWKTRAANYLEDLKDETLTGDSRAAIRKLMNDANQMVADLEEERAQIAGGLVDKERERAAYQEILGWCQQVKEARNELSYQQKRDFLQMLGIVVVVKCEKPYKDNSTYNLLVALPALQEIISMPAPEGDEVVPAVPANTCYKYDGASDLATHTPRHTQYNTAYFIGVNDEGWYINPLLVSRSAA